MSVVRGWKGDRAEQDFLREAFVGACRYFTTVLAPGSDSFHFDHLHLDLARHNPRGDRRVCRPALKFEARIDPSQSRMAVPLAPTADIAAIDLEEDEAAPPAVQAPAPAQTYAPLPPLRRSGNEPLALNKYGLY